MEEGQSTLKVYGKYLCLLLEIPPQKAWRVYV